MDRRRSEPFGGERFPSALGALGAIAEHRHPLDDTFALEVVQLARHGHMWTAAGYGLGSVVGGVLAAWCGIVLAARIRERQS